MVSAGNGREHDVSGMTAGELERARRDLEVSLSLAVPGSLVREPILAQMSAVDRELAGRAGLKDQAQGNAHGQDR
jgi:hypothetical protein